MNLSRNSGIGWRWGSTHGIALIITLVMLAIITFMAVTFLVLTSREHGAVSTTTDQTTAAAASETALERAKVEILARIMASTNDQDYGLIVSTNYINPGGFLAGNSDPTNVNYNNYANGSPLNNAIDFEQNVANLFYNPRPPVFVSNPTNSNIAPEFRYYLDLNRNGRYDTNGFWPVIGLNGSPVVIAGVTNYEDFVGDPEWIGVPEYSDRPHSANNKFLARFAYLVVPAGKTLDVNYIHNDDGLNTTIPYTFARNMGVGTWEMNLAAFLVDLNTNQWGLNLFPVSPNYYEYSPWNGTVQGSSFQDAQAILSHRYKGPARQSMSSLFFGGAAAGTLFQGDFIDEFGGGGPPASYLTGTALPGVDGDAPFARMNSSWAGADNPTHYFTTQEFFDQANVSPQFLNRLTTAGAGVSSYDRYTFYRMLAQLGTDSAPDQEKINLNYLNVDPNGNVVSGMETNLIAWEDPRILAPGIPGVIPPYNRRGSEVFFMAAANKLMRAYSESWRIRNTNAYTQTYGMLTSFDATSIPVWVNGQFVYGPSTHRVLQLVANMYDAMTNRAYAGAPTYPFLPTVFRPQFRRDNNNNIFITNFVEVIDNTQPLPNNQAFLNTPYRIWDLGDTNDWLQLPTRSPLLFSDDSIYNVPLVIGAKKGLPNFNKISAQTSMTVVRRLQFHRTGVGLPPTAFVDETNQTYSLVVSNLFGADLWNSYSNAYPRQLQLEIGATATVTLTNEFGTVLAIQTLGAGATNPITSWPGFNIKSPKYSFQIPVFTNGLISTADMPNSPWLTNRYFESLSGFPTTQWFLNTRARTRCVLTDAGRIIDYVALSAASGPGNVTAELMQGGTSKENSGVRGDMWSTNRVQGAPSTAIFTPTKGIVNQVLVSLGPAVGGPNPNTVDWNNYSREPGYPGDIVAAQQRFYFNMFGMNAPGDGTKYSTITNFNAPFNPNRTAFQVVPLQANDPLVHYTIGDLSDLRITNTFTADTAHFSPTNSGSGVGQISARYSPWGGNPNKTGGADALADGNLYNVTVKDPMVMSSDSWDFPTNKFPNVGWLGRVHRGTPWQTVYLKASDATTNAQNWLTWVGGVSSSNPVALPFSVGNMGPVSDRMLFDVFTTAINDNATRGQLSINQTNLAAWSAALGGVIVLTNAATGTTIGWTAIEPAGYYDPTRPVAQQPALVQIWQGINVARANTNPAAGPVFFNHVFNHPGDILATPQLTERSPFLNLSSLTNGLAGSGGISDEVMERIPQQVLSLLTVNHSPRFVVYAYGQTLKPADHSLVTGGPFAGLCTNYQVTAETVTRAVVRVEGSSDPANRPGNPDQFERFYPPHIIVERYNVLPPD